MIMADRTDLRRGPRKPGRVVGRPKLEAETASDKRVQGDTASQGTQLTVEGFLSCSTSSGFDEIEFPRGLLRSRAVCLKRPQRRRTSLPRDRAS